MGIDDGIILQKIGHIPLFLYFILHTKYYGGVLNFTDFCRAQKKLVFRFDF